MQAESMLVSMFPESAIKFVVTSGADGDFQSMDNLMCFSGDFNKYFSKLYNQYHSIKTIYTVGPTSFIAPFVKKMRDIADDDVNFVRMGDK